MSDDGGARDPREEFHEREHVRANQQRFCAVCYARGKTCDDCRRHQAIGVLVELVANFCHWDGPAERADALDAIAALLGNVTRLRRAHNRDMREEQRSAQADARGAYQEGLNTGRSGGGW